MTSLTLPLEPTDDRANPAFKSVTECQRWLDQLQLTNVQLAHSKLLIQLDELNRFPIRSTERLAILETLREPLEHVQQDYARKLFGKPLLLSEHEYITFVSIVSLWQGMVLGYQRCLQDYLRGDRSIEAQGALVCQRCLLYSGLEIFEYLRTGYEFDGNLWHQLHNLYAFTESEGLHLMPVADALHKTSTTCSNSYVKTLLACDARPAELSRSQLRLLDGWLSEWSREIQLERHFSVTAGDAVPLAVDLEGTQGLQSATLVCDNQHTRYLALVPLSKLLRVKTILLQQGSSPEKVGLGRLPNADEGVELLSFLHYCWCEAHNQRSRPSRNVGKRMEVCHQPMQIFGQLQGKHFAQPFQQITAANRQREEAFERVDKPAVDTHRADTLDFWSIEDDGLLGVQLLREAPFSLHRLHHGQLLALRIQDSGRFMLGVSTWLKVARSGRLQMGARYFPGVPEPVWVRHYGLNQANEPYQAGFLLPAVRELNIPSSLLLPIQFFQAGKALEMLTTKDVKATLKMGFSVERGADYERISFDPLRA